MDGETLHSLNCRARMYELPVKPAIQNRHTHTHISLHIADSLSFIYVDILSKDQGRNQTVIKLSQKTFEDTPVPSAVCKEMQN